MKGELSGRQYPIDALTRLWLTRHVQKYITDNPDATDLFFSRIKPPSCPPLGMKGLALATWVSSWQSVTKEKPLQGGVGEGLKIRRIGFIREPFERVRTEPKAKEHNNVVLSSRLNKVIGNRE